MSTMWIPMQCPDCGNEDDGDAVNLERGDRLRCDECGATMEPLPGYGFDDDEDDGGDEEE